jgi:multiple sugar transport system permease protein
MIDGCSRLSALVRVVLPLSAPGLTATAIFSLLAVWSEFFLAVIFTSTDASKTISVVAAEFSGRYSLDYGGLTASAVLASLPPVVLAILAQRFIVGGLTAGGVRG